ncbi:MAG: alpha/beta hydrolase [Clostridiales bacterium]|jgi:acetyl esterase/lipase|nr:alpha/beta hydrolase [Clostridiales bacterium]
MLEHVALKYSRLKERALSLSILPVLTALTSKGIVQNKVVYGEPAAKLTAVEMYSDAAVKKPVLVYIHGGGWVQGSTLIRTPYCSRFAEMGFYVLSINYELAPESKHPVQIRNIFQAVSYLYGRAEEMNLDMNAVFFAGDSAGGHLAALAAGVTVNTRLFEEFKIDFPERERFKIRGMILVCGLFDFMSVKDATFKNRFLYVKSYTGVELDKTTDFVELNKRQDVKDMTPLTLVNPDFPPCAVLYSETDGLGSTSELLLKELNKNGVFTRSYAGTGILAFHCFPLFDGNENGKRAMEEVYLFLNDILGGEYTIKHLKSLAAVVHSDAIKDAVIEENSLNGNDADTDAEDEKEYERLKNTVAADNDEESVEAAD